MSWLQLFELSPFQILQLPRCQWFAKRGWQVADKRLHVDNKVALTSGVNQTILLDLDDGSFVNLVVAS